jgi:Na+-translocating ferredoxin:NAD+ oxidoreductase RnfC subunit
LIEAVRVDQDTCDKWLDKAQVDNWSEMDAESIQKCIDHLTAKLPKSAA